MDPQNAIRLLDDTFNSDFNTDRLSIFIKELVNEFDITYRERHAWSEFKSHIDTYQFLGSYTDKSKKSIDVLAVKLKRTSSIDRARVKQRNFVAKYLSNNHKDAALVAFYGDDPEDWRFSFVKLDYHLERDEFGKVKPVEDLTPAKRYSYLVGVNEPNYTCKRQFLDLIIEENQNPSIAEIENVFSIDNVTQDFFTEYSKLFSELEDSLSQIIENHSNVKEEFDKKDISPVDFSKKLLGQIVFLYFLQKKGWLGVKRENKWGTGPKDFMVKLFGNDKKGISPLVPYCNFFNEILEPLFYDALSNSREGEDGYYTHFKCKIPFLNGGLFEPINDYDWVNTEIYLENEIFEKIFDVFNRFNFTIKEDEPLDKEVAVDPEMLGKVFENLLNVVDRKSKGAFYTPREIVHYMCQQSLINYLGTNTDVPVDDIETFIQHGEFAQQISNKVDVEEKYIPNSIKKNHKKINDLLKDIKIVDPAVGSGAFPMGMMNEIVKARSILSWLSEDDKPNNYDLKRETIENCLYGVDIDSSAVDITKLRFWLSLVVDETDIKNIKPLPNLDHRIMCGNSLLEEFEGIKLFNEKLLEAIPETIDFSIEQINVEIKKLYSELGEIHTGKREDNGRKKEINTELKMFDKKKKSILSRPKDSKQQSTLDQDFENKKKESLKKIDEHQKLQTEYFNEENRGKKRALVEKIDKIEWELIEETLIEDGNEESIQKLQQYKKAKSKPFFLWKLYFVEIFQQDNPGFDVVIGNPPYVRQESIKHLKPALKNCYSVYNSTSDLYTYFYELTFNLLRKHGVSTFITSNKWMRTAYGKHLRQFFLKNTTLMEIINFSGKSIFESATVDTNILIFRKGSPTESHLVKMDDDLPIIGMQANLLPQVLFSENSFVLGNAETEALKSKIEKQGTPLKDWNISINYGIKTGFNEAFIIDTATKERLCQADPKNAEIIKPILRGRNIKKYSCKWAGLWIIFIPWHFPLNNDSTVSGASQKAEKEFQLQYPTIYDHLLQHKSRLSKRNKAETGIRYEWYALQRCAASYYNEFEKEKIIYPNMTAFLPFYYDIHGFFSNDKSFIITGESLKYLVSFLNSNLFKFAFKDRFPELLGGTRELRKVFFDKIPVKIIPSSQQAPFINLVDQIINITENDDYSENPDKQVKVKNLETQIDQIVYKLYDLTPEEIKIVEKFNEGK